MKIMTTYEESQAVQNGRTEAREAKSGLTRKQRLARTVAAIGVAAAAAKGYSVQHNKPDTLHVPGADEPFKSVVLDEGQSLWEVAKEAYPDRDPRSVLPMLQSQIPDEFHGVPQMHEQFILPADAHTGVLQQPVTPTDVHPVNK